MIPVPWRDILEIVPSKSAETSLTVTGRTVKCPPEKNLVMKAYRVLKNTTEIPPVDMYLHKIIPDGAGLGGGSADAAFTILALNKLFSLALSPKQMAGICAEIGSDCPYFIYDRPMLVTGTGTQLTPIDNPLTDDYSIIIVKPPVSVSTAEAYSGVTPRQPEHPIREIIKTPINNWPSQLHNDFEISVRTLIPDIDKIKQTLYDMGCSYAAMSGSGSAVYGLFNGDIMSYPIPEYLKRYDHITGHLNSMNDILAGLL